MLLAYPRAAGTPRDRDCAWECDREQPGAGKGYKEDAWGQTPWGHPRTGWLLGELRDPPVGTAPLYVYGGSFLCPLPLPVVALCLSLVACVPLTLTLSLQAVG